MSETPFLDGWKADLASALSPRGARSELARWLAQQTGSTVARWKVEIARTLNSAHVPGGEFVLAVNQWRAHRRPSKTRRTKKTDG